MTFCSPWLRASNRGLLLILLVGFPAVPVAAQSSSKGPPDSTAVHPGQALPEILVEEERSTEIWRAQEILPLVLRRSAADLAEALAGRMGLYLHTRGPGAPATPRGRGWDGSHTALVLDGVRMVNPQSGQVDLSVIPTSFLESARVSRSGATPEGGIGGTVQLRTVRPQGPRSLTLESRAAAFGGKQFAAILGHGSSGSDVVLGLDISQSAGSFPSRDGDRRAADGRRRLSVLAKATGARGRTGWSTQVLTSSTNSHLPGPANGPPRDAWQDESLTQAVATLRGSGSASVWSLTLVGQTSRSEFEDIDANLATSATTRRIGLDGSLHFTRLHFQGGVGSEWFAPSSRRQEIAFLDQAWQHEWGAWRGQIGLKEELRTGRFHVNPRVSLQRLFRLLRVSASLGRSTRHPTFIERFWPLGGNPDLREEVGWSADVSLGTSAGKIDLEVTGFAGRLKNRVVWHPSLVASGLQVWRPENVGLAASRGAELSVNIVGEIAGGYLDASWTQVRDLTDARAASYEHQLRYHPKVVAVTGGWVKLAENTFTASGRYTGRRAIASDGTFHEPAFAVFTISASRRYQIRRLEGLLSITMHNALDSPYEVVRLYPMPGRHLQFQIRLDLS